MSTNQVLPPPPVGDDDDSVTPPPTSPAPSTKFSLEDVLRRWQAVLLQPTLEKMESQKQGVNWPTVWYSLLGLALVQTVVSLLERAGFLFWNSMMSSPQLVHYMQSSGMRNLMAWNPGSSALEAFAGAFIGFFLMTGLIYLVAKALGGAGSFLEQTYLLALIYVPLQLIASVAGLIPGLGGLIAVAATVYMVVLLVMAIASLHQLTISTAIVVVILPVIVTVLLVVLLAVMVATLLAGIWLIFHMGMGM